MNCDRMQENLFDYLDDALPASEKAAIQNHLDGCISCREAVRRELQLARSLSSQLDQAVATVALGGNAQRRMMAAVAQAVAKPVSRSLFSIWSRLALPLAATAGILLVAIWLGHQFTGRTGSHLEAAHVLSNAGNGEVLVHVSYCAPIYTFRKEGNLVIDSLSCDARVTDGALLAKN